MINEKHVSHPMENAVKRYGFLTLLFLAMVLAILVSSYEPATAATPVATATQAAPGMLVAPTVLSAAATQAAPLPEKTAGEQPHPVASPTSIPAQVIPVTAPATSSGTINAEVTPDVLNVRVGPGMNHRIMRQLVAGQMVVVEGRSKNTEWVAVRLADGIEGWVYASYLRPSADLSSLPVMEAYGGPLVSVLQPTSKPSKRYRLDVSIGYNQAEVYMSGFAPERDVTLRLAVPGEGLAVTVATTTTDAQGSANLTFDMPSSWPDGSAVTQNQMVLQVLGSDGKLLGKATIYYQSGE